MSEESAELLRWTAKWCGICQAEECRRPLPPLRETAEPFFMTGAVKCSSCGRSVDVWASARTIAREDLGGFIGLPSLGASLTLFTFELSTNEVQEIDFSHYGVPNDAVILFVNYTPNAPGCFPVELHGNQVRHRMLSTRVSLFGRPSGGQPGRTAIACAVCWIREAGDSEPWLLIADAFEAAAAQRYSRLLVPAHSAIEISLSRLIRSVLCRHASKERVDQFIANELTSSSAQNVLLPYLCAQADIPLLREEIRGVLSRLRSLRNKVAHEGLSDDQIGKAEAGELLCAAVFGFEFVRFLRSRLTPTD